jgi:hypothetical protein
MIASGNDYPNLSRDRIGEGNGRVPSLTGRDERNEKV